MLAGRFKKEGVMELSSSQSIVKQIEDVVGGKLQITKEQKMNLLQELCAYMFEFQNYQPLSYLLDKKINPHLLIQRYWIFLQQERRVQKEWGYERKLLCEAQVAYSSSFLNCIDRIKRDPQFLTIQVLDLVIDEFTNLHFPRLRDKALEIYTWIVENKPQFVNLEVVRKIEMMLSTSQNRNMGQILRNALLVTLQKQPQLFKDNIYGFLLKLTSTSEELLYTTQFVGEGLAIQSITSTYLLKKVQEVLNEIISNDSGVIDGDHVRGDLDDAGDSEHRSQCNSPIKVHGSEVILGTPHIQFIRATADDFIPRLHKFYLERKIVAGHFDSFPFENYSVPLKVLSVGPEENVIVRQSTDFTILANFEGFRKK